MAVLKDDEELPDFHDAVPTGTLRPYGSWGSPVSSRRGVLGRSAAKRNQIEINWWGDERSTRQDGGVQLHGNSQVAAYAQRTREILSEPLAIEGGVMVLLRWENDTYLPEPALNVRRVRQLFTIDTQ